MPKAHLLQDKRHPQSPYTGVQFYKFTKASRHLNKLSNTDEAVRDILLATCPSLAEFLGLSGNAKWKPENPFSSRKVLERCRVRLDMVCMLLRRIQTYVCFLQQVSGRETGTFGAGTARRLPQSSGGQ